MPNCLACSVEVEDEGPALIGHLEDNPKCAEKWSWWLVELANDTRGA
jgi:hypothetical protein